MRRLIRPKLALLTVLVILIAAAIPMVISTVHPRLTHAAPSATVTIPSMKLPWDKSLTTIPFTGGSLFSLLENKVFCVIIVLLREEGKKLCLAMMSV